MTGQVVCENKMYLSAQLKLSQEALHTKCCLESCALLVRRSNDDWSIFYNHFYCYSRFANAEQVFTEGALLSCASYVKWVTRFKYSWNFETMWSTRRGPTLEEITTRCCPGSEICPTHVLEAYEYICSSGLNEGSKLFSLQSNVSSHVSIYSHFI